MNKLKEFKYLSLAMLLFGFVAVGSLSSCKETKKEKTEQAEEEHPEGEAKAGEEHPEGEEHPAKEADSTEHPEE
ncbi:hypothetical protein OOZ15_04795 [Galbibacter sp. EGI 63066]|uniref:hypothetical protein n=1 Tax=Galbibacter sp. EGI 63066 TaxID=2993559 RepID=UPI0022491A6B|nr:hypothetical protein [Galbibacter sp. EGI 63066]MCX2679252.1 hypothetical protein [Galbibacter sp. EGI 63066]